ncbi:hypothetical protein [Blastochloris viridis]|uniref:hypothetical protein n=1 Tax=Blastochloris viridis TaxID=1079 RepID=UPI0018D28575|nr:hypothetical protein [Blastochloris viridis]
MQLVEAIGRAAAAFDDQRRLAEMSDEVFEFRSDVARVQIDQNRLHLPDVGGLGLAGLGDRSRHHIERRALARRPACEGHHLVERGGVSLDPSIVRAAVETLPLVDEAANWNPAVAIAEDDVEKDGDLLAIRLDVEGIGLRGGVIEVAPRIEMDDVVVGHAGNPQQRSAHGHIRHS